MENANIKTPACAKEEKSMSERRMEHPIHGHHHPIPPHERRGLIQIQFDETDWEVFKDVFGGEDEAGAAIGIIQGAPPEIQILAAQLLIQIEKEVK